jgi:hypothetical protein
MLRRVALVTVGVLTVWLVVIVVLGVVLGDRQAESTAASIGESMQATAAYGDFDLALVRGHLEIDRLAIRRDDAIGKLSIDVGEVFCDLPPLGLALADGECRELRVTGTRLEASTAALFKIKNPKRKPVRARHVVIDDAELAFAPSAFAPNVGRIAVAIEHAEAGATRFRTPLSWIFALEQLRARVELPGGLAVRVTYDGGVLSVAGAVFGSSPVELPLQMPSAETARDGHDEFELLVATGRDIAAQLVERRAENWLRERLH